MVLTAARTMLYIRIHRITTVTQFVWVPCVHDGLQITTAWKGILVPRLRKPRRPLLIIP